MNVYEATQERLKLLFSEFDNIYISFSGGKDSGLLLNLCVKYIKDNHINKKLGVFHLDYEAQYQYTTDYVHDMYEKYKDYIDVYHICVAFKVPTCTSMFHKFWRPWEKNKKNIWVREKPKYALGEESFCFFKKTMWDYDFQEEFSKWIHKKNKAKKTACLVGIRTDESLNRWRAIHKERDTRYMDLKYSKKIDDNIYNFYPIYDWKTEDIWIANSKFNFNYNKIYDIYYKAGLSIHEMRVASPFLSTAQSSLHLYRAIEPNTWAKMISRVNGVNFTGIYGRSTAMGWKNIKLPKNHTWQSYAEFLLSTLPKDIADNYKEKLNASIKFWKVHGGALSSDIIEELKKMNINFQIKSNNYNTEKQSVIMSYMDDIDIKSFELMPTYKRFCICILKNDHFCEYMGFSKTKEAVLNRKNVLKKYMNI